MEIDGIVYKDPRWIDLADFDGDDWLDLAVPETRSDRSFILWGGPEGFDIRRRKVLLIERMANTRAADLDGNGYLDLLLGGHARSRGMPHDSFLHIYFNGPQGLRQDRFTMLPASGINSLAVADFDNNGLLDVFICSYHAGTLRDCDSYLYWNRKGRGFSAGDRLRMFMHSTSGCVAADFNEDGWTDLAVANHKVWGNHRAWSAVWWNSPRGFRPDRITRLPSKGPHGMTLSPGNQLNRGPEEYYQSRPFQMPKGAAVRRVSWQAEVPAKTWVKAQVRVAHDKDALGQAPWVGPQAPDSWLQNDQAIPSNRQSGRWVQYRLALGASNGLATPRVREVRVVYGR